VFGFPRHLRDHDNIVKLLNVIPQEAPGPTSEIYLIFEYMPSDLSKFIRSGADPQTGTKSIVGQQ